MDYVDYTEIETSHPVITECTAVRVTPTDGGTPAPQWAMTYRFNHPVRLAYVSRQRLSSGHVGLGPLAGLVAFITDHNHPEGREVAALGQGLWQRRHSQSIVDTWGQVLDGSWYHIVVPNWQHAEKNDWTPEARPSGRVHAVGYNQSLTAPLRWPTASPDRNLGIGLQLHMSQGAEPPPPAGFPPRR